MKKIDRDYINAADNLFLRIWDKNPKNSAYAVAYLRMSSCLNFRVKWGTDSNMLNIPKLAMANTAIILNISHPPNPTLAVARKNKRSTILLAQWDDAISFLTSRDKNNIFKNRVPVMCYLRMLSYFQFPYYPLNGPEQMAIRILDKIMGFTTNN